MTTERTTLGSATQPRSLRDVLLDLRAAVSSGAEEVELLAGIDEALAASVEHSQTRQDSLDGLAADHGETLHAIAADGEGDIGYLDGEGRPMTGVLLMRSAMDRIGGEWSEYTVAGHRWCAAHARSVLAATKELANGPLIPRKLVWERIQDYGGGSYQVARTPLGDYKRTDIQGFHSPDGDWHETWDMISPSPTTEAVDAMAQRHFDELVRELLVPPHAVEDDAEAA